MLGWANSKPWISVWVIAKLVRPLSLLHLHNQEDQIVWFVQARGSTGPSASGSWQVAGPLLPRSEPAHLHLHHQGHLYCAAQVRWGSCFPKCHSQLCTTFRHQHAPGSCLLSDTVCRHSYLQFCAIGRSVSGVSCSTLWSFNHLAWHQQAIL